MAQISLLKMLNKVISKYHKTISTAEYKGFQSRIRKTSQQKKGQTHSLFKTALLLLAVKKINTPQIGKGRLRCVVVKGLPKPQEKQEIFSGISDNEKLLHFIYNNNNNNNIQKLLILCCMNVLSNIKGRHYVICTHKEYMTQVICVERNIKVI